MSHRLRAGLVLALLVMSSHAALALRPNYLLFTDPAKRFSVEFPKDWKWVIVAGSGEALVMFVQPKNEASVIVERFRMKQNLAPADITDLFVEIEADVLKENQPRATSVEGKVLTGNGRRTAVLDYTRPGLKANERVRQFSYPVEDRLYRVTCVAADGAFKKYEPAFANIAESLKSARELEAATAPKSW